MGSNKAWTTAELELLEQYPSKGWNIPELLKVRTVKAIKSRARKMGLSFQPTEEPGWAWTPKELELLKQYPVKGCDIPELLRTRSARAITHRACKMGLHFLPQSKSGRKRGGVKPVVYDGVEYPSQRAAAEALGVPKTTISTIMRSQDVDFVTALDIYVKRPETVKPWTEEEQQIIRDKFPVLGKGVMEYLPGRTWNAIQTRAYKLGLSADGYAGIWTQEERKILKTHFPTTEMADMVKLLPRRSKSSICNQARLMHLRRHVATNLTNSNSDVKTAYTLPHDFVVLDCAVCNRKYIMPFIEAFSFTHQLCSTLLQVPDGWLVPQAFRHRSKILDAEAGRNDLEG